MNKSLVIASLIAAAALAACGKKVGTCSRARTCCCSCGTGQLLPSRPLPLLQEAASAPAAPAASEAAPAAPAAASEAAK
jgi:hypothetical protein